jgi:thioesterase domain-containing protein
VILLDTFTAERAHTAESFLSMRQEAAPAEDGQLGEAADDAWLTAVAHYFALDWASLEPTDVPTLLVRAGQPMGGPAAGGDWQPSWTLASQLTVVDVPGDHFTMMADHARATTQAVDGWLTALPL